MKSRWIWLAVAAGVALVAVAKRRSFQGRQNSLFDDAGDDRLNDMLEDSFPASDPPSNTPMTGPTLAH